jgi:DNA-binding transcriptional ArsR family regulator
MGLRLVLAVWDSSLPARLKLIAALVATIVRDDPIPGGKPARTLFASVETIARKLGVTPKNARRHLRRLEKHGVLVKLEEGGGRRRFGRRLGGLATTYVFVPEALTEHPSNATQIEGVTPRETAATPSIAGVNPSATLPETGGP